MTGLEQSIRAADDQARGDVSIPTEPMPVTVPVRRRPGWFDAIERWRGIGWFACGVAGSVGHRLVHLPQSRRNRFQGGLVLRRGRVLRRDGDHVADAAIQRQANQNAAEAAERHRKELAAAEENAARELALIQTLHRVEMEAKDKLYRAEVDAQRELARVERINLVNQLQRQALIEVSRTVNGHTRLLATLWNEAAGILLIEDRDEREHAMNPIFEQISQVVNDFSVEVSNAHLLIDDDRLHRALNRVNEAVLMGIRVAEDVHDAVVDGTTAGQSRPVRAAADAIEGCRSPASRVESCSEPGSTRSAS